MSLIRNSILLFLIHILSITIEAINYLMPSGSDGSIDSLKGLRRSIWVS